MKPKISTLSLGALLLAGGVSLVFAQKKTPRTPAPLTTLRPAPLEKVPLPDEPPPPPEEVGRGQFFRDRQFLNGILKLNFAPLAAQPNNTWVVAQFQGERAVGIRSKYDAKTNSYTPIETIASAQARAKITGEYRVIASLTRAPQQTLASYSWKARPLLMYGMESPDDQMDSVFGSDSTLICRINGAAQGRPRFGPFTIIPPELATFVKPAFDFYKSNPALFTASDVTASRAPLTALLGDPNPLLATFACRKLARAGQLDAAAWGAAVNRATGMGQALLIAESAPALIVPPNAQAPNPALAPVADALELQLLLAVKNATNAEALKPLALGIALLFERAPFDPFVKRQNAEWHRARRLSEAVRLKGRSFKTKTAADAYVTYSSRQFDYMREANRAGVKAKAAAEAESAP